MTAGVQGLLAEQNTSLPVCAARVQLFSGDNFKKGIRNQRPNQASLLATGAPEGKFALSVPHYLQVSGLWITTRLYLSECVVLTVWALKSLMHFCQRKKSRSVNWKASIFLLPHFMIPFEKQDTDDQTSPTR